MVQEGACDRVMRPRIHLVLFSVHVEIASVTERLSVNKVVGIGSVIRFDCLYRKIEQVGSLVDTQLPESIQEVPL